MAQVISAADYRSIADNYADLRTILNGASAYLYDAVYTIVQFDDIEPTIDLLQTFYDTYTIQTAALGTNTPYLSAVRAINNHILHRAVDNAGDPYTQLDDWLFDNGFSTAPGDGLHEQWINMSKEANFDIDKSQFCDDCV